MLCCLSYTEQVAPDKCGNINVSDYTRVYSSALAGILGGFWTIMGASCKVKILEAVNTGASKLLDYKTLHFTNNDLADSFPSCYSYGYPTKTMTYSVCVVS